jgi:hypothetical protein
VITAALIVGEEEESVVKDRAADGAAEDISRERILRRNRRGVLVGPGICIEVVVGEVVEGAPMPLVGAALRLIENVASEDVAKLRRVRWQRSPAPDRSRRRWDCSRAYHRGSG